MAAVQSPSSSTFASTPLAGFLTHILFQHPRDVVVCVLEDIAKRTEQPVSVQVVRLSKPGVDPTEFLIKFARYVWSDNSGGDRMDEDDGPGRFSLMFKQLQRDQSTRHAAITSDFLSRVDRARLRISVVAKEKVREFSREISRSNLEPSKFHQEIVILVFGEWLRRAAEVSLADSDAYLENGIKRGVNEAIQKKLAARGIPKAYRDEVNAYVAANALDAFPAEKDADKRLQTEQEVLKNIVLTSSKKLRPETIAFAVDSTASRIKKEWAQAQAAQ